MNDWLIAIAAIAGTALVYGFGRYLYKRYPQPFTLPIVTGTLVIVIFLVLTGVSYSTYMTGGQWIEHLLGPAVVALALPLYKQRDMLKKYFFPLTAAILVGVMAGVITGYYPARWLHIDDMLIASALPKSVTTPVAMDVSDSIGGTPSLAVVFVMVAGIGGVITAPYLFKWCGIHHELPRGIAIGTASHAIGTAKALENSEREGAVSSVAMTFSALLISVIVPSLAVFLF
ncbi:LrgB family protein [Salibacterium salarium]|uniref:LrgB family protein n=1 Tax=Salibacterium salarium TaxID=284579 RepID=A0A3R9P4V3_9BACI|nr:LrgB family protein [Salibacterium salarium]RSL32895.1 LrgB family protein [Salibacterium salarium]